MPPEAHALLGASSAHRWLACPPSARLSERLEGRFGRRDSIYAREGTKAHSLGEMKIRHAVWQADKMTAAKHGAMTPEARAAYTGIPAKRYTTLRKALGDIPDEMEKATDSYCDVVMDKFLTARESDPSAQLFLEQRLDYSVYVPHGFGTGDAIVVSDSMLEVMDFKYGKGVFVSAEGNPQMRLYALGAIARFGSLYDFENVRCTIIQPRLNSVSEEFTDRNELTTWATFSVAHNAQLAWDGEGDFCPGEHCRFCTAKPVCAARAAQALTVFNYGLAGSGEFSDDQIAAILGLLDETEAWIRDIRAYAEERALAGQRFPGFKLVRGKRPNRMWADPEAAKEQLLRSGYGPEVFEVTALKSVGAIEKALGKKAFQALLSELVTQGEGPLKLVPESDERPEYNSADAAFDDMTEGGAET